MAGAQEDPALAEVKAILQRLQRLDLPDSPDEAPSVSANSSGAEAPASSNAGPPAIDVFARKQAALSVTQPPVKPEKKGTYSLIAGAAALIVAGTGGYFFLSKPPVAQRAGIQSKEDEAKILSEARRMIGDGNVVQGREALSRAAPESYAGIALLLAQTYDPNYLAALAKSDAKPDKAEASRWYRIWFALAVKNGLELDSDRLQLIINAMH
jgi:hypothetical protein